MTKQRIIFNRTLRAWEIVGLGVAYGDLPAAFRHAVEWERIKRTLEPGPRRMGGLTIGGVSGTVIVDELASYVDHDQTVEAFRTHDGNIIYDVKERFGGPIFVDRYGPRTKR